MSIRLLLLRCCVTALGVVVWPDMAAAHCIPGPVEKVVVKECARKDAEWAILTLADNTPMRYRAYYVAIPYERRGSEAAEQAFLRRINPCNTIRLNREASLRREEDCCDVGSLEQSIQCQQYARAHPWFEAMQPKNIHIPEKSKD